MILRDVAAVLGVTFQVIDAAERLAFETMRRLAR